MNLPSLNLPAYPYKSKQQNGKWYILDMLRRQYVRLTPEEWVRQHFLWYLINEKKYPSALIALEYPFEINGQNMRCDIAIFDNAGKILAAVECKSTEQTIDQSVFDQIFTYNTRLKAQFLMITNGLQHYCCKIDVSGSMPPTFLNYIPHYSELR